MNVGAPFIAYFQAAHLAQPRQGPLHDPAVATEPLARLNPAPGDARFHVASPERPAVCPALVGFVGVKFLRAFPRATARPADRLDGVKERFKHRRLVAVGGGQRTANGTPCRSTTRRPFDPGFPRSVGFGPVFWAPFFGADRRNGLRVHRGPAPVDKVSRADLVEKRLVQFVPDASFIPVAKSAPAGHAATASHFLREHLPGNAAHQNEDDFGKGGAVRHTRSSAFRFERLLRKKRLDDCPQFVENERFGPVSQIDFKVRKPLRLRSLN